MAGRGGDLAEPPAPAAPALRLAAAARDRHSAHTPVIATWASSGVKPRRRARASRAAGSTSASMSAMVAALPADQVVVLPHPGVVDHAAPDGRDAAGEPELLEQLQRRVDRRQRDAGHPAGDLGEQELGGDVAVQLLQGPGDREPLRRDPLALVAQRGREGASPW